MAHPSTPVLRAPEVSQADPRGRPSPLCDRGRCDRSRVTPGRRFASCPRSACGDPLTGLSATTVVLGVTPSAYPANIPRRLQIRDVCSSSRHHLTWHFSASRFEFIRLVVPSKLMMPVRSRSAALVEAPDERGDERCRLHIDRRSTTSQTA